MPWSLASQKESEFNHKLLEAAHEESRKREELQNQNIEMSRQLADTMKEMK